MVIGASPPRVTDQTITKESFVTRTNRLFCDQTTGRIGSTWIGRLWTLILATTHRRFTFAEKTIFNRTVSVAAIARVCISVIAAFIGFDNTVATDAHGNARIFVSGIDLIDIRVCLRVCVGICLSIRALRIVNDRRIRRNRVCHSTQIHRWTSIHRHRRIITDRTVHIFGQFYCDLVGVTAKDKQT